MYAHGSGDSLDCLGSDRQNWRVEAGRLTMLYVEYLPLYMESSAINKKDAVGGRGEVTVLEGVAASSTTPSFRSTVSEFT